MTSIDAGVARRRTGLPARAAARPSPVTVEALVAGGLGALLLLAALVLPLWQAELQAPQYPGGLRMQASAGAVTGDVAEINLLNHYVGMKPFDKNDIPELSLWLPVVLLGLSLVGIATVGRRRSVRILAKAGLFAIPLGVLADIQWRLWQYGHDLNPDAALRIGEFTPWVLGRTKVWNFNTLALPGAGLVAAAAAALVVTVGPPAARRIRGRLAGRPRPSLPSGATLALVLVLAFAAPVSAEGGSGHDHHAPRAPLEVDAGSGGELQRRLAAAPPGGTVVVEAGTHHGPLVIDRPLTLTGRGRPVIDGGGEADVLVIRAPGTVVRGLHVRRSGRGPVGMPAGIRIEADDVTVEDVMIDDVYTGIVVTGAARTRIVANVIHGRGGALQDDGGSMHAETVAGPGDGISLLNVKGALVRDNQMHHVRDGMYLSYGEDLFLDRNHVRDSRFGLHDMWAKHLTLSENRFEHNLAGAVLMYGGPVLALRNRVTDHRSPATGFGFLVRDVADAHLAENVIARNTVGVQVEGAPLGEDHANRLVLNTIARNDVGMSTNATAFVDVGGNSFVENVVQVLPQGRNALEGVAWRFEGTGNYWSDYRGYDVDGDGVGDVPHPIGDRVDGLFTRSPALVALRSSPALRLLGAVEERFLGSRPAALAPGPLMRPHSPPLEGGAAPGHAGLLGVGAALVGLAVLVFWRLRCSRPIWAGPIQGEVLHVPAA